MATYEENMNDLMKAAQLKLETQKKQQTSENEDIYAEMRAEMENEEYQESPVINRQPEPEPDISIDREPEYIDQYYTDPDDTPIFEGGPGISQIDVWKKQFTKEKIFHTQILDKHFVFRTLNRFEYIKQGIIKSLHDICTTCVLWPRNYDFKAMAGEDGGYPSTLAQIIMENSGFTKEYGIEVL